MLLGLLIISQMYNLLEEIEFLWADTKKREAAAILL